MKCCYSFGEHHVRCPGHKRQRHTFTIYSDTSANEWPC